MKIISNPWRGQGAPALAHYPDAAVDAAPVRRLLAQCPVAKDTPLVNANALAADIGVAAIHVKDERGRMGLGSFKALGAAYAIAKAAAAGPVDGVTFVTASAGNHGLSVAAGARVFGARSVVYLAETVPAAFADLLRDKGAEVVIEGHDYEASMVAAARDAKANGWRLLSDSTWEGYNGGVDVMEGYLAMAEEARNQIETPPTHIFLQAGVGGLAAACAAYARAAWGDAPIITVVEPDRAETLLASIKAGAPTHAPGETSSMGRLDCKDPSHVALKALARNADFFMALSDEYVETAIEQLAAHDLATSPSGGAGFAGLTAGKAEQALNITPSSRVLLYLSEGPVDA
ncbi:MAG: pyridoxal-phosphate dependent enzyme [Pikeienuella sp.]